jgi:hypothetical protein
VKREKRVSSIRGTATKARPKPRLIQGRSVETKVATGPFTYSYGKSLAYAYNPGGKYLYTGGCDSETIGRWFDEMHIPPGYTWLAYDCRRWDSTVGPTPMSLLWEEYNHLGAPRDCLLALQGRSGSRKAVTSHGIRFSRTAQVASGDGDTSAGNSRIHLVLLESCPGVFAAAVSGDDAIILANDPLQVEQRYKGGGFDPVRSDDFDFCSQLFWPTSDGRVLGPKVGRTLGKMFHCTKRYGSSEGYHRWLRGVSLGARNSFSFIPVLRVLVPHILSCIGHGRVDKDRGHQYKARASFSHDICDETWAFFEERYGLSQAEVVAAESLILSTPLPITLRGDLFVSLVQRDYS